MSKITFPIGMNTTAIHAGEEADPELINRLTI